MKRKRGEVAGTQAAGSQHPRRVSHVARLAHSRAIRLSDIVKQRQINEILAELYNESRPVPLTRAEAESEIVRYRGDILKLYNSRQLSIDLTKDWYHPHSYDMYNGKGTAAKIIADLRATASVVIPASAETHSDPALISIKGLDKAALLMALYNAARPVILDEADVAQRKTDTRPHYVGHFFSTMLGAQYSAGVIDPTIYNRINGDGAAQAVIKAYLSPPLTLKKGDRIAMSELERVEKILHELLQAGPDGKIALFDLKTKATNPSADITRSMALLTSNGLIHVDGTVDYGVAVTVRNVVVQDGVNPLLVRLRDPIGKNRQGLKAEIARKMALWTSNVLARSASTAR